jgi:hypothetical protein
MPVIVNSITLDASQESELLLFPKTIGNAAVTQRADGYGSPIVNNLVQKNHLLAREGSYLINQNPTIGTGVKLQGDTTTAWVATTPSILLVNTDPVRNLYVDYIKLLITIVGAGLAQLQAAAILDIVNRYASSGTEVTANTVCPFTGVSNINTAVKVYYGATASAATAARQIGRAVLRGAIPVVNDQYVLSFGGGESSAAASAIGGTGIIAQAYPMGPAVVAPGGSFLLYLFAASMSTSPSCEYEIGMWLK